MKIFALLLIPAALAAQNIYNVTTTTSSAIIRYSAPDQNPCTVKLADMDRGITIASGTQSAGTVMITTTSPHGLLTGAVVYVENSGVTAWNGWQTLTGATTSTFTFASGTSGTSSGGNIGVLVNDVNASLGGAFAGANSDSRTGSIIYGTDHAFVPGSHAAPLAGDSNRYGRALQVAARHHPSVTCGGTTVEGADFRTQNIPLGNTHNDAVPLSDPATPGQYAYPTIQWTNPQQAIIDPISGLRTYKVTFPSGTTSGAQRFSTAPNSTPAWTNPTGPLTSGGGAATYTGGACAGGGVPCALFLRADSLSLPGGASFYSSTGSSLDWFQFAIGAASISNGSCTGDDCKIVACLTVNGVSCASGTKEQALTASGTAYTLGSQTLMDLWQSSGPPTINRVDASKASGSGTSGAVTYVASTKVVTYVNVCPGGSGVCGSMFDLKWAAGSRFTIGSTEYCVASVQSERQLTLAGASTGCNAPPASDISSNTAYSAPNFGVLIWKKTATADTISIGNATYLYGSTTMPSWPSEGQNNCGPIVTDPNGVSGYPCLVDRELYFFGPGNDVRDLGHVGMSFYSPFYFGDDEACGTGGSSTQSGFYQFDPDSTHYPSTWYCSVSVKYQGGTVNRVAVVQGQYRGNYARTNSPGVKLPDCLNNGNTPPCIAFTLMQPNQSDSAQEGAPLFNPDYAASGCVNGNSGQSGVSPDGDLEFYINCGPGQDYPGWEFIYTLGDRTPTGTSGSSFRIVAAGSVYRHAPASFCSIHDAAPPFNGWTATIENNFPSAIPYTATLTSTLLNTTPNVAGGLNACPANPLSHTGNDCTLITVGGQPANGGVPLQNMQNADNILINSETMRVLDVSAFPNVLVQRGYLSTAASHGGTTLTMGCASTTVSLDSPTGSSIHYTLWNYRADPMGTNSTGNTIITDSYYLNSHNNFSGGQPVQQVYASIATLENGYTGCPLANGSNCYQTRTGYAITAVGVTPYTIANNAPFAGVAGCCRTNNADMHPGPMFGGAGTDAKVFNGGANSAGSSAYMVGPFSAPFAQVGSTPVWKASGTGILNRKFLSTMAYVGRFPLSDVSGPGSVIDSTSAGSYTYCVALLANECQSGSSVGDVFVNAPYVGYPYCYYAGVAVPNDDVNGICIADLGSGTGSYAQINYARQDLTGAAIRHFGPILNRWNQLYVFWSAYSTPNLANLMTRATWVDGISHIDLMSVLPPMPQVDGVNRNTFIPIPVTASTPQAQGIASAAIEFWYGDTAVSPTIAGCTSRLEKCEAVGVTVNQATPFYFASETFTPMSCATSCTISIPALSQRILHYRWKYFNGSGTLVSTGRTNILATP